MNILTPSQQKALIYDRHISLTANAGSGKTLALSKRYVEIAMNCDISLRNIAAITFTEMAAGELYKKITAEINERLQSNLDRNSKKRLHALRRQLVSANISTIHSFCADLLREFPLEAEVDANFIPIDETASNELILRTIEETICAHLIDTENSFKIKHIIRFFGSKDAATNVLFELIKKRKSVYELKEHIYSAAADKIALNFRNNYLEYLNKTVRPGKDSFVKIMEIILSEVILFNKENEYALRIYERLKCLKTENDIFEILKIIKQISELFLIKNGEVRTKGFIPKDIQIVIAREVEEAKGYISDCLFFDFTIDDNVEKELAHFGKSIIEIFHFVDESYEYKKREFGYLDFEDLVIKAKNVISNRNALDRIRDKYKFIMIDEYQDSDDSQYNIFMPILDELKTNNLFVVGDEKQSIYSFRNADIEIFQNTKESIKISQKGEILTLPDSFRMNPEICAFVNVLFSKLFENPNILYNEVNYSEIVCAKNEIELGGVEFLISRKGGISEAELVARKIFCLVDIEKDRGLNYCDFAVLTRKRKHFEELERIFSLYKIPYNIIGGKGYFQRQSIYDIYNYLSFVMDVDNDASLVGVLRSPFFGMGDDEIYEISMEHGDNFWTKLKKRSKKKYELKKITALIEKNILLSKKYSPAEFIRIIITQTGYSSILSCGRNGGQELKNIEKLIELSSTYMKKDFASFYDLIEKIETSIESDSDEPQAPVESSDNAVKLMTVHQSKGLEFKGVFLYKCAEGKSRTVIKEKELYIDKKFGILSKVAVDNEYFEEYKAAPILKVSEFIRNKKDEAENKRLFYVAATRAKNYLFLSASEGERIKENSFIRLCEKALARDILNGYDFQLITEIKKLFLTKGEYRSSEEKINLKIPIINNIEKHDVLLNSNDEDELNVKNWRGETIEDVENNEIITATRISAYKKCPLYYKYIYEMGLASVCQKLNRLSGMFETDASEFDYDLPANSIGRVIHTILQKDLPLDAIETELDCILKSELEFAKINAETVKALKNKIAETISKYYKSKTYRALSMAKISYNEKKLYAKINDFYLHGVIDKLIIDKDRALIVDYKTGQCDQKLIKNRIDEYLPQLKFYAVLTSRVFPEIKYFNLKIVFIENPDLEAEFSISLDALTEMLIIIIDIAEKIRKKIFSPNKASCHECHLDAFCSEDYLQNN